MARSYPWLVGAFRVNPLALALAVLWPPNAVQTSAIVECGWLVLSDRKLSWSNTWTATPMLSLIWHASAV
jgi:hypothetical protein